MNTQELVALGSMWPDGHSAAIEAAIDYIGETNPHRVIATAGATESFLRALRDIYNGWVGVHVSKASLCRLYDAESLDTTFEFARCWVTYAGPLAECRVPQLSVLKTAKVMQQSVVSGSSADFQTCSHTPGLGAATFTLTGVGIGHLSADKALAKRDLGFAHAVVTDSAVDVALAFYQKGAFQPPRHDRANDGSGVRPKK